MHVGTAGFRGGLGYSSISFETSSSRKENFKWSLLSSALTCLVAHHETSFTEDSFSPPIPSGTRVIQLSLNRTPEQNFFKNHIYCMCLWNNRHWTWFFVGMQCESRAHGIRCRWNLTSVYMIFLPMKHSVYLRNLCEHIRLLCCSCVIEWYAWENNILASIIPKLLLKYRDFSFTLLWMSHCKTGRELARWLKKQILFETNPYIFCALHKYIHGDKFPRGPLNYRR